MRFTLRGQSFKREILLTSIGLGTCLGVAAASGQGSFYGLGGLMPDAVNSIAMAISDDGSTVVGASTSIRGSEAYRFANGKMEPLGFIDGESGDSTALGVSADGTYVVGSSGEDSFPQQAFAWSSIDGLRSLGFLDGGRSDSAAFAVSSDGQTVVGRGYSEKGSEAFVTSPGNELVPLHTYRTSDFTNSGAVALSADGSVAAGFGNPSEGVLAPVAFTWSAGGGTDLGTLPGATSNSLVNALSPDGMHATGWSFSTEGVQAALWSAGQPPYALGDLAGGGFMSVALDVSGDGSIVVGYGSTDRGFEAFIWTEETGMIRLVDFLEAAGVNVVPWILVEACGISADGGSIAGTGINPNGEMEAWLVTLSNDVDGDGIPDSQDLFPNSEMSPTLLIGGTDTGIANQVLPNGATLADLINDVASSAKNKGLFTATVVHLATEWVRLGYLSKKEKGLLQRAAAKVRR